MKLHTKKKKERRDLGICTQGEPQSHDLFLINDGYEKGFVARHGYKLFYLMPGTEGAKSQMDDTSIPPIHSTLYIKFEITALKLEKWFRAET